LFSLKKDTPRSVYKKLVIFTLKIPIHGNL